MLIPVRNEPSMAEGMTLPLELKFHYQDKKTLTPDCLKLSSVASFCRELFGYESPQNGEVPGSEPDKEDVTSILTVQNGVSVSGMLLGVKALQGLKSEPAVLVHSVSPTELAFGSVPGECLLNVFQTVSPDSAEELWAEKAS